MNSISSVVPSPPDSYSAIKDNQNVINNDSSILLLLVLRTLIASFLRKESKFSFQFFCFFFFFLLGKKILLFSDSAHTTLRRNDQTLLKRLLKSFQQRLVISFLWWKNLSQHGEAGWMPRCIGVRVIEVSAKAVCACRRVFSQWATHTRTSTGCLN